MMAVYVSKNGKHRLENNMGLRSGCILIDGVDVFGPDGKLSQAAIKAGWREENKENKNDDQG